ncbi:MAG: hypothetical protein ACK52I_23565 [Pseudomonadota bacterium]|jgi:hypothetical protein
MGRAIALRCLVTLAVLGALLLDGWANGELQRLQGNHVEAER